MAQINKNPIFIFPKQKLSLVCKQDNKTWSGSYASSSLSLMNSISALITVKNLQIMLDPSVAEFSKLTNNEDENY